MVVCEPGGDEGEEVQNPFASVEASISVFTGFGLIIRNIDTFQRAGSSKPPNRAIVRREAGHLRGCHQPPKQRPSPFADATYARFLREKQQELTSISGWSDGNAVEGKKTSELYIVCW